MLGKVIQIHAVTYPDANVVTPALFALDDRGQVSLWDWSTKTWTALKDVVTKC